jgi:hypothetical protein
MSKKFSYDFVANYFKSAGCDLLETSYVNNHTPMQYRCNCGNVSKISFSHFKEGKRCRSCGVKKLSVAQKFSFDYVNDYFRNNGCVLLSEDYINQTAKLSYICVCGNKSTISFKNFKRGVRCRECYLVSNKGSGNPRWKQDREKLKFDKSLKSRFRRCLRATLTAIKKPKKRSTDCLLGYTPGELENHILSHPNWVRCKNTNWHLDHIFPIEAFVQRNIHDVKLINCLDNLQPLPAKENLTKYTTYDSTEFDLWLKSKGML